MILDIHTHIIPYVDDGCRNLEDSIKLIKDSVSIGVTHIIATPHQIHHRYENNKQDIIDNFNLLKEEVIKQNIPIKLYLGEEVHYSFHDLPSKFNNGELMTLNNSNVILLEFSYEHKPNDVGEIIYNLNCDGYKVIVAHVERYKWISLDIIKQIHDSGNYIQVNDDALIGKNGFSKKAFTKKLLKLDLIDFVASDMHFFRPTHLDKALKLFKNKERINKNIFNLD